MVFDTNVLLSLWVFIDSPRGSQFATLRHRVDAGHLRALSRPDCLAEFERVLGYPEFKLDSRTRQAALDDYAARIELVATTADGELMLPRCSDRDDQKFLELAHHGAAQFLVTSDKALLKLARRKQLAGRFEILTPEVFMQRCNTMRLPILEPHRPMYNML